MTAARLETPLTVGMLVLLALAAWVFAFDIDLIAALQGESPLSWVYSQALPANFVKDFPSLIASYGTSLPLRIYLWAYQTLGIKPETLLPFAIYFEVAAISLCYWFLAATLNPSGQRLFRVMIVILLTLSSARSMNFARFGQPSYFGVYYCFAEATRIIALALALRHRWVEAGVINALSFCAHPVLGLTGAVAMLATAFTADSRVKRSGLALGIVLNLAIAGSWMYAVTDFAAITASGIDKQIWFAFSRMASFHWYPFALGTFSNLYFEAFFPFSGLATIGLVGLGLLRRDLKRAVTAMILACTLLMIVGFVNSLFPSSPLLTKLALHRSNDLLIVVFWILTLVYMEHLYNNGHTLSLIAGMGVVLSPFFVAPGCQYPAMVLFLTVATFEMRGSQHSLPIIVLPAFTTVFGIITLVLWSNDYLSFDERFYGSVNLFLATVATLVASSLIRFGRKTGRRSRASSTFLPIALSLALGGSALVWLNRYFLDPPFVGEQKRSVALSYWEVQRWAQANTANDALFMVDPTILYGWRDYSQRSSFGNLREWIFSSWSYNGRREFLDLGLSRFAALGVDPKQFIDLPRPIEGVHALSREVRKAYYEKDDAWREKIHADFGVNYFVYQRTTPIASHLKIAYQNEHFTVVAPSG